MRFKDISVNLRERVLPSGKIELLFDYSFFGKRTRRTTGLFLEQGKTKNIRIQNEQTMMLALEKKKLLEDNINGKTEDCEYDSDTSFFDWFDECKNKRSGSTVTYWNSALFNIKNYEKDKSIMLKEINYRWIDGFIKHMKKSGLKNNSQVAYLRILSACLNSAVDFGIIKSNPMKKATKPKLQDPNKSFLTAEELVMLNNTDIKDKVVKQAFIFSCLTGLRFSDVKRLKWSNILYTSEGSYLSFRQKKTSDVEMFPINDSALSILGTRGKPNENVFKRFPTACDMNSKLAKWCEDAGILNKHITYHCSRHTFATLLLKKTNDIFMVSKMLGHRKLETTMCYAKLVDDEKRKAINTLSNII